MIYLIIGVFLLYGGFFINILLTGSNKKKKQIDMTQEEKQLLLKDLCGRIPYRVRIERSNCPINLSITGVIGENVHHTPYYVGGNIAITTIKIDEVKPYLRPMSSMTEEERNEWMEITHAQEWLIIENLDKATDWLNAHHFDYRGLIEKGLVLEAPEGMYNTSQKWTPLRNGLKENEDGQIVGGVKL